MHPHFPPIVLKITNKYRAIIQILRRIQLTTSEDLLTNRSQRFVADYYDPFPVLVTKSVGTDVLVLCFFSDLVAEAVERVVVPAAVVHRTVDTVVDLSQGAVQVP